MPFDPITGTYTTYGQSLKGKGVKQMLAAGGAPSMQVVGQQAAAANLSALQGASKPLTPGAVTAARTSSPGGFGAGVKPGLAPPSPYSSPIYQGPSLGAPAGPPTLFDLMQPSGMTNMTNPRSSQVLGPPPSTLPPLPPPPTAGLPTPAPGGGGDGKRGPDPVDPGLPPPVPPPPTVDPLPPPQGGAGSGAGLPSGTAPVNMSTLLSSPTRAMGLATAPRVGGLTEGAPYQPFSAGTGYGEGVTANAINSRRPRFDPYSEVFAAARFGRRPEDVIREQALLQNSPLLPRR